MKIEVALGDIAEEQVDAIVNAANRGLAGGGGVDGAIHRAAGNAELQTACRKIAPCDVGDAKATDGFHLHAKWIIHTVGPIWNGGNNNEPALLALCYTRCLQVADEIGAMSISFPSISTGAFRYPIKDAARIAVETVKSANTNVKLVRFVTSDQRSHDVYQSVVSII